MHERREVVMKNGEVVKSRLGTVDVRIFAFGFHQALESADIADSHLSRHVAP